MTPHVKFRIVSLAKLPAAGRTDFETPYRLERTIRTALYPIYSCKCLSPEECNESSTKAVKEAKEEAHCVQCIFDAECEC